MEWNVPATTWRLTPSCVEPIAELAGGLAREGDGEGVLGVDVGVPGLPGDATGQDARLARAGAGEDRQRNGARGDRLALLVIEALEQRVARARWSSRSSCDHTDRVRQQPRTVPDLRTAETGKAPSSLRCVAAPISSGPRRSDDCLGGSPAGGVPLRLRPGPWRRITPTFGHRPTPRTRIPAAASSDITSAVPLSPVPANIRPRPRAVKGLRALGYVRSMHVSARPLRGARRGRARLHPARPGRATWTTWWFSSRTGRRREQLGGRPGTLLGLYEGVQLTDRSPIELRRRDARPHHDLPGTVVRAIT